MKKLLLLLLLIASIEVQAQTISPVINTSGLAAIATSGSATDLTTGTISSGRVSGSYTGITGTGTLTAGITGVGFTIALGTSTLTGTLPAAQMPALTGVISSSAGSLTTSFVSSTGSGEVVLATSPTLITPILGVASATSLALSGSLKLAVTVVGSLPTCNGAAAGLKYGVTDALLPAALATVVGGGAVAISVYCNGAAWIVN